MPEVFLSTRAWPRGEIREVALCNMGNLYLRNVPDDVVERLERLARRDATSVSAVAIRELAEVSRQADNPALLGTLPDLAVPTDTLVASLDTERAVRRSWSKPRPCWRRIRSGRRDEQLTLIIRRSDAGRHLIIETLEGVQGGLVGMGTHDLTALLTHP